MKSNVEFRMVTYPGVKPESFMVSEYGDVLSLLSNRIIKPYTDKDGYLRVSLAGHQVAVHRLVAWQFVPKNRSIEMVTDHLDCNKQNNHYTNLEWVTPAENTRRAQGAGLRNYCVGENNNTAKYTEEFVREICEHLQSGKSLIEIFRLYKGDEKVHANAENKSLYILIARLKQRRVWSNVTKDYTFPEVKRRPPMSNRFGITTTQAMSMFSEEDIRKICCLYVEGYSTYDILEKMGIFQIETGPERYEKYANCIRSIKHGRSCREISKEYFVAIPRQKNMWYVDPTLILEMVSHGFTDRQIFNFFDVYDRNSNQRQYKAIRNSIRGAKRVISLGEHESISSEELSQWLTNQWGAIS